MNDEEKLEKEMLGKGLTAPKVCVDDIDREIVGEDYHVFPGTTVTICLLTLQNEFTVTGESACASPENFDEEIGMDLARKDARSKLWGLLGFRLRDKLSADPDSFTN